MVGRTEYDGVDLAQTPVVTIATSAKRIQAQLGLLEQEIAPEAMAGILRSLGFSLEVCGEQWQVTVPSDRATKDIEGEADLVEEVGRMIGYGKITPRSPLSPIAAIRLSPAKALQRKLQDYLVLRARCLEVMTYPLIGEALLKKCHWPKLNEDLLLANAISLDHDRMRPSLVPSILEAAARNQKYHRRFQFFELGRSYLPQGERSQVALAFSTARKTASWNSSTKWKTSCAG